MTLRSAAEVRLQVRTSQEYWRRRQPTWRAGRGPRDCKPPFCDPAARTDPGRPRNPGMAGTGGRDALRCVPARIHGPCPRRWRVRPEWRAEHRWFIPVCEDTNAARRKQSASIASAPRRVALALMAPIAQRAGQWRTTPSTRSSEESVDDVRAVLLGSRRRRRARRERALPGACRSRGAARGADGSPRRFAQRSIAIRGIRSLDRRRAGGRKADAQHRCVIEALQARSRSSSRTLPCILVPGYGSGRQQRVTLSDVGPGCTDPSEMATVLADGGLSSISTRLDETGDARPRSRRRASAAAGDARARRSICLCDWIAPWQTHHARSRLLRGAATGASWRDAPRARANALTSIYVYDV